MSEWYQRSNPMDIQPIPWLHPDAIAYLDGILRPDMEVLEHGSGGSTLWFAARVKHVTAYEMDNGWHKVVNKLRPANVSLRNASFPIGAPDVGMDLILIDGTPVENRAAWLKAVLQLVKPGGYVVLDNANRPEYKQERAEFAAHAKLLKCVNGNGESTEYMVTEFYRCG